MGWYSFRRPGTVWTAIMHCVSVCTVCACFTRVCVQLCCMCVCLWLALQSRNVAASLWSQIHTTFWIKPIPRHYCLVSNLSHRTINTFASPPNLFSSSFFSVSRRKKMFATSSRLSDVALYFVLLLRPHNSGGWILKHSQGPAWEGKKGFWSFNGGAGAK